MRRLSSKPDQVPTLGLGRLDTGEIYSMGEREWRTRMDKNDKFLNRTHTCCRDLFTVEHLEAAARTEGRTGLKHCLYDIRDILIRFWRHRSLCHVFVGILIVIL